MIRIPALVITLLLTFAAQTVTAQQLSLVSFAADPSDLSASVRERADLNNEPCALVKVELASANAEFVGDVLGTPEYQAGTYWVYMPDDSRRLQVYVPGYRPLTVDFSQYPDVGALRSKVTYKMTIDMPGANPYAVATGNPGGITVPTEAPAWSKLSKLKHLSLACVRDGNYYYFSQKNWEKIPSNEKDRFTKKGIVVIGKGECFIVDLHHSDSGMTWDEAMSRYGDRLPTRSQAEVMTKNYEAINAAIIAFGGDKDPESLYWTRTEYDSSYAWLVFMYNGTVFNVSKAGTYRVRAVAPLPEVVGM